jgi:hypothetical protein
MIAPDYYPFATLIVGFYDAAMTLARRVHLVAILPPEKVAADKRLREG